MSSPCLSGGGGRTYGLDLEFLKSASFSVYSSSSSPSSTISESSNSPLTISTKKPRTQRKRPNQTYNEASALLSTAYPNLFPSKTLKTQPPQSLFFEEPPSSEILLPFRVFDNSSSFLLHQHEPSFSMEPKVLTLQEKPWQSPGEINSASAMVNSTELEEDCGDDFDAESILDEEIEEGIDSIMGTVVQQEDSNGAVSCFGIPAIGFGGKLDCRLGLRGALRHVDDGGSLWNLPAVDILQILPKIVNKPPPTAALPEKKKKKKKVEVKNLEPVKENAVAKSNLGLMLKLNYEEVKNAWSDKGSPFADDSPVSDVSGNDATARLSQIELLWDNGGVREASVLRYKEKRRTRLFSKKIRYQVRKVNADQRPRMKGRFVTRSNSSRSAHR
ncbi:hypothetical protein TanjilG_09421 [Lupinus angustifolius]|uniref:CCT domain-containing protein n=1 Tax=Lupinus angustifolius TaxID=3871 RepID=A0A4P1RWY6_LUPAN|nr:PREDICTED: protein CHLOROPLAST IMPORT APPARATUS 2-like [Lupinus angustifolius]XP_019442605.1 PREDICTED: protein CHLOROPLAST IMPORT APPARATUS 2-like [Lupinus angustifolius]OIW19401.1 hypothetical protein TanjilG_09421 [Lupinus angustifolius]